MLGRPRFYLDANVFIYNFEDVQVFKTQLNRLFDEIREVNAEICTSVLTLSELLVTPFRTGNQDLAERYQLLFRSPDALRVLELDEQVMIQAAELRSQSSFRLPDAFHLASALCAGADCLVTGDRRMSSFRGLRVRLLQEFS